MSNPWIGGPTNPWIKEPEPEDESRFHPWPIEKGWHSWNAMSPELEFCEVVSDLASLLPDGSVILETGMGQGYITRRVLQFMPTGSLYRVFEDDDRFIGMVPSIQKLQFNLLRGSPGPTLIAEADLVILDSDTKYRTQELKNWIEHGKQGSGMIIHDTYHKMSPPGDFTREIQKAELEGIWLNNPRGGFYATHE